MAIQRDDSDERKARVDLMIEQFRVAQKHALVKRGVALWTRTEALREIGRRRNRSLPPEKIN